MLPSSNIPHFQIDGFQIYKMIPPVNANFKRLLIVDVYADMKHQYTTVLGLPKKMNSATFRILDARI